MPSLVLYLSRPQVVYVDTFDDAQFSDPILYLGDGHHLNDKGHTALARLLAPHLKTCLDGVAS